MEGTPLLRLFLPRPGFTRYVVQRSLWMGYLQKRLFFQGGGLRRLPILPNLPMVPRAGLEPARLAPLPPQDSVSTNSTTWARDQCKSCLEMALFSRHLKGRQFYITRTLIKTLRQRNFIKFQVLVWQNGLGHLNAFF